MVSNSRPVHSPSVNSPFDGAYAAPLFFAQALYRLVASRAPPADASVSSVGASPASPGQYFTIASRMVRRPIFEKSSSLSPYLTVVEPVMFFARDAKSRSEEHTSELQSH